MGHSETPEFVRRLRFLNSGPSVLPDAAHPLAPEMEIFSPKKKTNPGGLSRDGLSHTPSVRECLKSDLEEQLRRTGVVSLLLQLQD